LQDSFFDMLITKFDRQGRKVIYFDDFIQCCVTLHILTSAFKQHDTDLDGVVTITYEQFLMMVLSCKV
jgi:Ca2+-binding EF-hand superfamily protein